MDRVEHAAEVVAQVDDHGLGALRPQPVDRGVELHGRAVGEGPDGDMLDTRRAFDEARVAHLVHGTRGTTVTSRATPSRP